MLILSVIQGPDKGKRFELPDHEPQQIGRSSESLVLTDHTISRRHAELTPDSGVWLIRDLESSNGTFVNGVRVRGSRKLTAGDQIRTGASVLVFGESASDDPLQDMVRIAGKGEIDVSLEHTVAANDDSMIMAVPAPDEAAKFQLSVLYELITVTGAAGRRDELLEQVMDVIFTHFEADRGFILLAEHDNDKALPAVVRYTNQAPDEQNGPITVSKTIVRYVLSKQVGVLSSNAMSDQRFKAGDSVRAYGIRSAMCVPMRFKDRMFGVIQIDSQVANYTYTEDQLALLTAIGLQTGLALANIEAIENRVNAERLAAVGQTVAALSHSIKNIVQGMRGGAEVVELGLKKNNINIIRGGWDIVARNQQRVGDLVLNMLSYSKQRKPDLHVGDLNALMTEVIELLQKQAEEQNKTLITDLDTACPPVPMEQSGIHQAVLNLIANALYAVTENDGIVTLRTEYDDLEEEVQIIVKDNGEGMTDSVKRSLFQPFRSTKGYQGTGLGLAVTRKIVEEHGGRIAVESRRGKGTQFIITLPAQDNKAPESSDTHFDMDPNDLPGLID